MEIEPSNVEIDFLECVFHYVLSSSDIQFLLKHLPKKVKQLKIKNFC